MKKGRIKVMQGNEACVEAALLAGCRYFAGYPITPASEILEGMARRLPLVDGFCLQRRMRSRPSWPLWGPPGAGPRP